MKAEIVKELNQIVKQKGTLIPEDVVSYAENPDTALHSCFEWDNKEAGHQWRLHQARMLIRTVVTILPYGDEEREYRMFVSLREDRHAGRGYRTLVSVLNDDELREKLLQDALKDMETFKGKYKTLEELCEVFEAMDRVEKKIKKPVKKVLSAKRLEARA